MINGFVKVAAATPKIKVGDTIYNADNIIKMVNEAEGKGAKLIVFPELCITGYTCGDLFFQEKLIDLAKKAIIRIANETANLDIFITVGVPLKVEDKLYNTACMIKGGKILGFVPKSNIPNYSEFYELRHFNVLSGNTTVKIDGHEVWVGTKLIFCASNYENFKIACEICEDLWVTSPPSISHAMNGATVILNLSASDEIVSKADYRRMLVKSQSARTVSAYIYSDAGDGESTTDMVFSGHNIICEHGSLLKETRLFENGIVYTDIDVEKISLERRKLNTFKQKYDSEYKRIYFDIKVKETHLDRIINSHPFVPRHKESLSKRCEEIFAIQYMGLKKRLEHINAKTVTIGISGGLDSTLAFLVTVRAFDKIGIDRKGIAAITMPCFGTTDRTYNNARELVNILGAELREIPITESVALHLSDIGASIDDHDVTFENAQARERTQVLMDIANKTGGIVIGTGDLSELALGFATYNGDHMSMYGVNSSIPKTLVRYLVKYVADNGDESLKKVLYDILDTPVSPELLPPQDDGEIKQKTEDIIGPYELHDFFLYNVIRCGFGPQKIQRICEEAFKNKYDSMTIKKWLKIFYKRFFNNQFKRSAMPDGPKVGSVTLSPRADWRMPSDAVNFMDH